MSRDKTRWRFAGDIQNRPMKTNLVGRYLSNVSGVSEW